MSAPSAVLQIALRRRIWRVTLDGAFYGDYRSERHAVESVEAAATALRQGGRTVQIVAEAPAEAGLKGSKAPANKLSQ